MTKPLSDDIVEKARVLVFDRRLNWTAAARELGLRDSEGIRRRLDPEYRLKRNKQICASQKRRYRENYSSLGYKRAKSKPELTALPSGSYHRGAGNVTSGKATPPAYVIEEAARVAAAPLTLSMQQFGDPPPGRSALDRMRSS